MGVQKVIENASPLPEPEVRMMSPLVLAYVGDAVYEVYIRSLLARSGSPARKLHELCVQWVSAVGQERVWYALKESLDETERAIARRGRNAKGGVPTNVSPDTYRRSTSLECLVGYLFLIGKNERLGRLLTDALEEVGATYEET